jgi:hypothetical protein
MGEWNIVDGAKSNRNIVEPLGQGRRNLRGHILNYFCERNGLVIINMWLRKLKE